MSLELNTAQELIDILLAFIDITKEEALKRVLNFVSGLLNTENSENLNLALKLIQKLTAVIIPDIRKEDEYLQILNKQLVANLLLCIQMWTDHFPDAVSQLCLRKCNGESQPEAERIIAQIFDDSLHDMETQQVLSSKLFIRLNQLFTSPAYEERCAGHTVLKQLLHPSKDNELDLFARITIMECLNLQPQTLQSYQLTLWKERSRAGNWMRPLYIRLLQHKDIVVRRTILVFIMEHFTVTELSAANLMTDFLVATNCLELHNFETNVLPEELMSKIVHNVNDKQFLKALGDVDCLGVPLHRWLDCLDPCKQPQVSNKLLFKICANVRKLENEDLRNSASNRVCEVFKITIECLSVAGFMKFIEALFNKDDDICGYALHLLAMIIASSKNIRKEIELLTKDSYEMLSGRQDSEGNMWQPLLELIRQLENLPKAEHGWWRLPAFFALCNMDEARDFYRVVYDINVESMLECGNLQEFQNHLMDKLICQTEEEMSFVRQRSVDLFVVNFVHHWSQLEEFHLEPIHILENGTFNTLKHLAYLLASHNVRLPKEVLTTFLVQIQNYSRLWLIPGQILKYAFNTVDTFVTKNLENLIAKARDDWELGAILNSTESLPYSTLIDGLLDGESSMGFERIEAAFLNSRSTWNIKDHRKRNNFITYCMKDEIDMYAICNELLSINEAINAKEICLDNSKDHIIQMRIARTLCPIVESKVYWSDRLWTAVLAPKNHLNIKYIYEFIVARQLPTCKVLIEKLTILASLQPSQQESVLSVVHIYCLLKWESLRMEQLQAIFDLLLQQIMPLKIHKEDIDVFYMMVLRWLASKCEESSIQLTLTAALKSILDNVSEDMISENQMKVHLLMPEMLEWFPIADTILYLTNAPFDEYNNPKWQYSQTEMERLKSTFKTI